MNGCLFWALLVGYDNAAIIKWTRSDWPSSTRSWSDLILAVCIKIGDSPISSTLQYSSLLHITGTVSEFNSAEEHPFRVDVQAWALSMNAFTKQRLPLDTITKTYRYLSSRNLVAKCLRRTCGKLGWVPTRKWTSRIIALRFMKNFRFLCSPRSDSQKWNGGDQFHVL